MQLLTYIEEFILLSIWKLQQEAFDSPINKIQSLVIHTS